MATKLTMTQTFPAEVGVIRALQADPEYIAYRGSRTGATSVTSEVSAQPDGSLRITVVRVLPADVPSYAKSMIGDSITVTEHYDWSAPAADGSSTGTLNAEFSAPISCTATMSMSQQGDNTSITTDGEFKSSIPFVGGKVEDLAKQQILRYLEKEQTLAVRWLAGDR